MADGVLFVRGQLGVAAVLGVGTLVRFAHTAVCGDEQRVVAKAVVAAQPRKGDAARALAHAGQMPPIRQDEAHRRNKLCPALSLRDLLHGVQQLVVVGLVIAVVAKFLEQLEESVGLHLIGASVIAMFIGMIVNRFYAPNDKTKPGIKFTSKKVLKFAIVLLGASLNIRTVLTVGRFSLTVMLFTLATCFGLGALIGKALGLNWKTSSLINAGTGICGGSAIAAIAPVIEADDMDIAYGMSATFLFDTVMIVVFPLLGRWLGLSDAAFGLWAGTAVNDTSSVVATGYAFSEAAGDFATMVKLTRTLAIIPAVLVFAAINLHLKKKESAQANGVKVSIRSIFPWFILAFLAMSLLTSLGLLPAGLVSGLKTISKFLMVAALAAIGLNTNFKSLCRSGAKPMLHGFIISTLVVLVAIGVEYMIGIAPYGTL